MRSSMARLRPSGVSECERCTWRGADVDSCGDPCLAASPAHTLTSDASVPVALTVLGGHTAAMLVTIGIVSVTWLGRPPEYSWFGAHFCAPIE